LSEDAIYLTTSKELVPLVTTEKILFWKDKLVMPLDIAMKNAQLKKTPMSTILIIFVFSSSHYN
jgi:hypothetical protein